MIGIINLDSYDNNSWYENNFIEGHISTSEYADYIIYDCYLLVLLIYDGNNFAIINTESDVCFYNIQILCNKIKILKLLNRKELIEEYKNINYFNVLSGQYWCKNGLLHHDNDQPAIIFYNNNQHWYKNGLLHRDSGSAINNNDDSNYNDINYNNKILCYSVQWKIYKQAWYKNGIIHRDNDKPAIITNNTQIWYKNGIIHRDNGPALISNDTYKWYKNGKLYRENDLCVQINNLI